MPILVFWAAVIVTALESPFVRNDERIAHVQRTVALVDPGFKLGSLCGMHPRDGAIETACGIKEHAAREQLYRIIC
jgi:hypothetical protein